MPEIESLIVGSEKLTSIFGRWPSFHDAEVHELLFQRGHIDTDAGVYEFPHLTIKLRLWLLTSDLDQKGYYVSTKHTLATMKFFDVDNFKMEGFTREEGPSPYFEVDFEPSFGIDATFTCSRIEIIEAVPCNVEGGVT
jgi:hypothetical protein